MKTLKTIALFIGVIVGIFILSQNIALANQSAEKNVNTIKVEEFKFDQSHLVKLENQLIEEYLDTHLQTTKIPENEDVNIYTVEGKCVYKGQEKDAEDLLNKSDVLFHQGNTTYYVVTK